MDVIRQPKKPFKFFNFWFQHDDFLETVKKGWEIEVKGNPMMVIHKKLKLLKPVLKKFNKERYSNISERVLRLRDKLDQVQRNMLISRSDAEIATLRCLKLELLEMRTAEESFYRQNSIVQWL